MPRWAGTSLDSMLPPYGPLEDKKPILPQDVLGTSCQFLYTWQNIALWSQPYFSINESIFGLPATMSDCYKRRRPFQGKQSLPQPRLAA